MKKIFTWITLSMSIHITLGMMSCFCAAAFTVSSQSIRDVHIAMHVEQVSVEAVLAEIEEKTEFSFVYLGALQFVKNNYVTIRADKASVADILTKIAEQTRASFRQVGPDIVVKPPPDDPKTKNGQEVKSIEEMVISGKVTDENGEPLAGANVFVKSTTIGTTTDADGNYRFSIPDEATTLVFSYIGYVTEEAEIAGRAVIDMVMLPDVTALEEITVSTGYWEVDKRLNPGNIAKVDAQVIEQQPVVNPLQAIQGRVAGVQIQQTSGIPGSPININIRGLNSLRNGQSDFPNANLPFYVIDGVPFTQSSLNAVGLALSNGHPLSSIRPSDIESIEILKDADATAIYGSRGANGVILITTKKGRAGNTKVDINFSRGIGHVANRVDLLNTAQYLAVRQEALVNDGDWPITSPADSALFPDLFAWDPNRDTNWQEELLGGTAAQTNASASISGGSDQNQFIFRTNFFKQTNVFSYDNSAFESGSGHFNLNHLSTDGRFNANLSTTYNVVNNKQNGRDFTRVALLLPPNAPAIFTESGQLNWEKNFENPLSFLRREYENRTRSLITNLLLNYKVLPGLILKSTIGYTNTQVDEIAINPISSARPGEREFGSSSFGNGREESWIIEPQVEYRKELGQGILTILTGATLQNSVRERSMINGLQYTSDDLLRNIEAAGDFSASDGEYNEYKYNAIFTRINYTWSNKYIINATGRRDGSSRFGPGQQFGNFGAVGTAWIFSEESFVKNAFPFMNFGKLRASYGLTGNDQIRDYGFLDTYSTTGLPYNDIAGLTSTRASNPDFSWETNKKLEFGMEIGLLQNRVLLNASWFRNRTSDQLVGRSLPVSTGYSSVQFNFPALVENRGWEIELSTINISTNGFEWSSAFNITRARNELVAFPNIQDFPVFDNRYEVGKPLFGQKQYRSLGVNPETGIYDIVDFNEDGRISSLDRQDFVEQVQDYFGGFNNTFQWRGFRLDVQVQFVQQEALDFLSSFRVPGNNNNLPVGALERWQNVGDITSVQRFTNSDRDVRNANIFHQSSNSRIVDASFIRLQNVSFSWTVPSSWIEPAKLERASLYLQGQNLWTLTDYDGLDPESGGTNLPPLRIITTGIQITF